MTKTESVAIVGAGLVGFATGTALAKIGHHVTYVDANPDRVADLTSRGYRASTLIPGDHDIYFLSVPTPSTGSSYDYSVIEQTARSVGAALRGRLDEVVIVVRSTVAPCFSDQLLRGWVQESLGGEIPNNISLVSAPEFLRQDSAEADAAQPWITVVGGHSDAAVARVAEMFAPLGGELKVFGDPTSAEMVKVVHNCFNATKISFWNEIASLCSPLGIDQLAIAEVVAKSAEASFNPNYGIRGGYPFGGACLPKDLDGLLGFAQQLNIDAPLLAAVKEVNRSLGGGLQ
jgi:UDPglucose 6-dehydrogenase